MFICFLFESWMKYQYYSHVCELSMSKVKLLYQPTRWFCHSVISSHCVANFGSFECFKLFFFLSLPVSIFQREYCFCRNSSYEKRSEDYPY